MRSFILLLLLLLCASVRVAHGQTPRSATEYYNRGLARFEKEDAEGAIADLTKAIKLDPTYADAYYIRGIVRGDRGDADGAIEDYNRTIQLRPGFADAYYMRGLARDSKNDVNGAIADYTKTIELNPSNVDAYHSRGLVRDNEKDYDGAIADYTKAIQIKPSFADGYDSRGLARQAKNDLDGAIADYTRAIELNPSFADAYFNRGLARRVKNDVNGAIADLTKAIEFNPGLAEAYLNRGLARSDSKDLDGAIADYTKAIALKPDDARSFASRGSALLSKGKDQEAEQDFKRAIELDPTQRLPAATPLKEKPTSTSTGPVALATLPASVLDTELKALSGRPIKLSNYSGRVLLVTLWATWCGPCRFETPELVKLHKQFRSQGVDIVELSTEDPSSSVSNMRKWVRNFGVDYRVGWATQEVALTLMQGRDAIPQTFVISRAGRIVRRFIGFNPTASPPQLREAIKEALNDRTSRLISRPMTRILSSSWTRPANMFPRIQAVGITAVFTQR
jgi:tetratricopeptide (TPR) repeat protein/glutathione peroxidase-family protein